MNPNPTPRTGGTESRRFIGFAPRSGKPPSAVRQWWTELTAATRRQLTVGGLLLVYLLILGVGGWYNVTLYMEQSALEQAIANHERELARAPQIRMDGRAEEERRAALQRRSDDLYARLPDVGAVPVIVGQMERMAQDVGGAVTDIQYTAPFWEGDQGRVAMRLTFVGGFDAVVQYLQSVSASLATLHWDFFDIQPADERGRDLVLNASVRLDVLRDRPAEAAVWRETPPSVAAEPSVPSPFAVSSAAVAARPLPPMQLQGIVQQNGRRLALVQWDGDTRVVSVGEGLGDVTVVDIQTDRIVVGNGERTAELRMMD